MSFEEELKRIGELCKEYEENESLATEEATKMSLISPFINNVLGYNVFNPEEIIPETNADLKGRSSEKVDYSIIIDGKPEILIEAKHINDPLSKVARNQLARYFHVTESRLGILTNGKLWRLFADIDKPNVLDETPFLVIDLSDPSPIELRLIKLISKPELNLDALLSYAETERHTSLTMDAINAEFKDPSDELIKLFYKLAFPEDNGRLTAAKLEGFKPIVQGALDKLLEAENEIANISINNIIQTSEKKKESRKIRAVIVTDINGRKIHEGRNLTVALNEWFAKLASNPVALERLKALAERTEFTFLTTDKEITNVEYSNGKNPWIEVAEGFWIHNHRNADASFKEFEMVNSALGLQAYLNYKDDE